MFTLSAFTITWWGALGFIVVVAGAGAAVWWLQAWAEEWAQSRPPRK